MERRIVAFETDEVGDWRALLECHHRQHVRHRPPLWPAAWVEDDAARASRIGTMLSCPLCDRCEAPDGLIVVRTTPTWDEATMPDGLRHGHRVAGGTWGRLVVSSGRLRFVAETTPRTDVVVEAGSTQDIPPDVEHSVAPDGAVRFAVEFLTAR